MKDRFIPSGRSATPVVTTPETPFEIGGTGDVRDAAHEQTVGIGDWLTPFQHPIKAAEELNAAGIGASVLHMATIKQLDTEALLSFAK